MLNRLCCRAIQKKCDNFEAEFSFNNRNLPKPKKMNVRSHLSCYFNKS